MTVIVRQDGATTVTLSRDVVATIQSMPREVNVGVAGLQGPRGATGAIGHAPQECSKGDACAFVVTVQGGIDAAYTKAEFQVHTRFDDTPPLLLGASETDGIAIDHGSGTIAVTMGALKTGTLPVVQQTPVAAKLRLTSGTDPNDAVSWVIPFTLLPELIA